MNEVEKELVNERAALIMQDAETFFIVLAKQHGLKTNGSTSGFKSRFIRHRPGEPKMEDIAKGINEKYQSIECGGLLSNFDHVENSVQIFSHPQNSEYAVIIFNFKVTGSLDDHRQGGNNFLITAKKDSPLCQELQVSAARPDLWVSAIQNSGMAIDKRSAIFFDADLNGTEQKDADAIWLADYDKMEIATYTGDNSKNPNKEIQHQKFQSTGDFAKNLRKLSYYRKPLDMRENNMDDNLFSKNFLQYQQQ